MRHLLSLVPSPLQKTPLTCGVFCLWYDINMNFDTPPLEVKKGLSDKSYPPEKTFFFQREDGSVFSVNEQEAWSIYTGKMQTVGVRTYPPKLIGTSDGIIFHRAVQEAKEINKKDGFEAAQDHIRKGIDLELEEAKKHPQRPRDFSSIGLNGRPVNMDGIAI